ncbi:MAG: ABC transporter ATP-binding protein [Gammaproteobacteria bacterium]|nr:ABC transporter ATP-binding protein [Gammaproteobacteria bacterium]
MKNCLEVNIRRKIFPGADVAAVEGLMLSALPGEFVAIVGPSGAGKSTLLNLVAGLDREMDGDIQVDGQPLHADGLMRVRLGFVFQEPRLMPWLTVIDNLMLVLENSTDSVERVRHLLREVGLSDIEQSFPNQLSGGMQRRVSLVRAFVMRPELLLMDEPFLSLDAPTAARLRLLLLTLWGELHPTVLFVTHQLREALALADRVLFLSSSPGRVVLEVPVQLPRPRELGDASIGELHDRLLVQYPELLSGLVEEEKQQSASEIPDSDNRLPSSR